MQKADIFYQVNFNARMKWLTIFLFELKVKFNSLYLFTTFFNMNINPQRINDQVLLKQLQEGNSIAFEFLFDKYWEFAFLNAYKRLKSSEDAKDIVQEIFTHIWQNRHSLLIKNIPAYLHVAVRNRVFKQVALQKKTHPFFHILENQVLESNTADSEILWEEFKNSYEALIQTLPPKRQEIFRLRFHEDFTTQEIAKNLCITRKTVQNQIGKALETLKVSLAQPLSIFLIFPGIYELL